ncbi:MAG: hypothetical protein IPJ47_20080 [Anaerolineales bacterium]|nr:hypothetical protein [Anaerolineales bacterium]
MRRNQLFWGGVLILVGGLMLGGEMGVRLPNGNSLMSLFWPILLVGVGIWVLVSVFLPRNTEMESASVGLQGARSASVKIKHGAGEFRLHSGASGNDLLHGAFAGGLDHKAELDGDQLKVKLRPAHDFIMLPPFGSSEQLDWDVSLNAAVPMALDMNMGANKSVLDLRDMSITDIKLKSGASETVITLPANGRLTVDCEVGAAALTLIVPEGVSIRARASIGAGDFSMDKSRFPNNESPDFATAQNAIDIYVKGGAASVRIK